MCVGGGDEGEGIVYFGWCGRVDKLEIQGR